MTCTAEIALQMCVEATSTEKDDRPDSMNRSQRIFHVEFLVVIHRLGQTELFDHARIDLFVISQ